MTKITEKEYRKAVEYYHKIHITEYEKWMAYKMMEQKQESYELDYGVCFAYKICSKLERIFDIEFCWINSTTIDSGMYLFFPPRL